MASTPTEWAADVLPRLFQNDLHATEPGPRSSTTLTQLLDDDHAELRRLHCRLVADGATPQAAAHYLVGWFPGLIAAAVGYGLATARAGFSFAPSDLIFDTVAEGWPESLRPTALAAVVDSGHPWAGQARVTTTAELASDARPNVAAAASAQLVDLVGPFVVACQGLARTRVSSLWNEIADGLGHAVAHQRHMTVTQAMLDDLSEALDQPGAPWNRRPRLSWAASPSLGDVHVAQKGGCCLAFTDRTPDPAPDEEPNDSSASDRSQAHAQGSGLESESEADADLFTTHVDAYRRRFPEHLDVKKYCSTCRFRSQTDVDDRQLFWAERRPTC